MEVGGHRSRRRRGRATRGGGGSSGFLPASDCFSPSSEACEQLVKALLLFFLLPRRRRRRNSSPPSSIGRGGFHARLRLLCRRPEAEETHLDLLKIIPSSLPSLALCFPVSPAPGLCTHWPDATGLAPRLPPPLGWLLLLPSRRGRGPPSRFSPCLQYTVQMVEVACALYCNRGIGTPRRELALFSPVEVALLAKE